MLDLELNKSWNTRKCSIPWSCLLKCANVSFRYLNECMFLHSLYLTNIGHQDVISIGLNEVISGSQKADKCRVISDD